MGKCDPPAKGGKKGSKRPPGPFLLYYLDRLKRCGGNYYGVAKSSGERWRAMSQAEKDKWYNLYYSTTGNKNSRSYKRWKKQGGGGGGGCC